MFLYSLSLLFSCSLITLSLSLIEFYETIIASLSRSKCNHLFFSRKVLFSLDFKYIGMKIFAESILLA